MLLSRDQSTDEWCVIILHWAESSEESLTAGVFVSRCSIEITEFTSEFGAHCEILEELSAVYVTAEAVAF